MDSAKISSWTAASITWQPANPDGTRLAILQGDREKAGEQFTYALSLPAGFRGRLHKHSADLRVSVLKGELRLGSDGGEQKYSEGSYLLVPAGVGHYDAASVETVIVATAVGPWSTDFLDAQA